MRYGNRSSNGRRCGVFLLSGFDAEKVTERGRWLADLHIDRPLIVG